MSVEDFRINAYVRQVLSRCWVDSSSLRYGAVGRVVYFHGRFRKFRPPRGEDMPGARSLQDQLAEDAALLVRVEKEVRREATVLDVVFRLENFRKVQGKWSTTGA